MLVVYIFYPLYKRINAKLKMPNASAVLCTIIVFFIIIVPLVIFITSLSSDVSSFYVSVKDIMNVNGGDSMIEQANNMVAPLLTDPKVKAQVETTLTRIATSLLEYSSKIILSIPMILLNLVIFVFLLFSFFRDGERLIKRMYDALPLKKSFKRDLKKQTSDVLFATIYGNVVIALVQGIIGAIAFSLLGIGSPVLLGFLIFILALLPFIGAGIIWIPAVIIQFFMYSNGGPEACLGKAIGLLIAGIIMSSIDLFIKPKIIGKRAKLHPALVVLGIFGGVALMGFIGFFLGPIILAFFMSFLTVYERDKYEIIC